MGNRTIKRSHAAHKMAGTIPTRADSMTKIIGEQMIPMMGIGNCMAPKETIMQSTPRMATTRPAGYWALEVGDSRVICEDA